jgi:hypothetical protein
MAPQAVAGCVTARFVARCCVVACCCLLIVCRQAASDVRVTWTIEPNPPVTKTATSVRMTLLDRSGKPASGAKLRVEAHMTHPGMAPVMVDAVERRNGSYEAHLLLSMAGDWVFVVTGVLADGSRISRETKVEVRT